MQSSLDLNGGQEILSLNVAGSNAIILPGRKHSTKKMNKVSEIQKKKRSVEHSKSQQKKLKKIQEDKEKELLISKSIETLEKYKIGDVAQSLMWTSKNLGQIETFQAKRRREVQFSKAGLRLPTNNQPIKRKTDGNTSEFELQSKRVHIRENCDVSNFTYPLIGDRGCMQDDICGDICGDVGRCEAPVQFKETSYENSEIPVPVNQQNLLPSSIFTVLKEDKTMDKIHRYEAGHLSSISNLANGHPGGARTAPIAVHVSRPPEIENTRKDLPIVMMEQEIMEAINENICVIICGETGCGKTTQVPQFMYEAGFGSSRSSVKSGMIGVTQPRRVAVLATAKRVAFELGLCLGKEVGFQVRHDKRIGDNCSIKFMTDGILLRELQNDFLLKKYSVIVLDEAHERSLNTDILIGMLSRIIHERQRIYEEQKHQEILLKKGTSPEKVYPLKLVLMSATLRIEDFVSGGRLFSEPPPVIEVPARQFPVDIHFSKRTEIVDYVGQAYKKVLSIHKNLPPGGILVFVTGQREVEYLCQKLRKASRKMVTNRSRQIGNAPALLKVNCAEDHVINDISKALEIEGDLILQQTDRFSSYDDDYDDLPEDASDASFDSNEDSDLEVSGKDMYFFGQNSMGSNDFPREDGNFTSLKAAFDALAGKNTSKLSTDGKKTAPDTAKGSDHCALSLGENTGESGVPPVSPMCVLPLYAMLPAAAQLRVFDKVKDGERLVVIATNVAETSLTIPGTKYVVDTGREKVKLYDSANGMETYNVQWISKASAAQRAGRAGRTGPGHCYRLFSSAVFSNVFHDFSNAEISKIPVDGVVLLMKSMGIDKVVNFPFPTPPKVAAIKQAEKCLKNLEALDTNGRLTPLGKAMVHYPMSPRHSRMLLTAIQILQKDKVCSRPNLVLGYAVAAAAALSLSNPFITQLEGNHDENSDTGASERVLEKEEKRRKKELKEATRASREKFCNPTSDILSTAYALQCFELSNSPIGFCAKYALHLKTMGEMSKLRRQLLKLVFQQSDDFQQDFTWTRGRMVDVESSWRDVSKEKHLSMYEEELLGQAICAGCVDRVAKKIRACSDGDKKGYANRYQACTVNETVILHCRSSLSRSAPEYLVYSELLHTKHPYIHGATTVKPEWLVRYASSLCTFSASRICYEHLSDQVLCRMTPIYGPCQWQLPVHSSPIKDDAQRVAVFAYSLIGGYVLPCLKYARNFLANSPAIILRAESSGHKRVGNLLSKLKMRIKTIDSCAVLKEVWSENPLELYPEILDWFQERFRSRFDELWAEMQREVLLDPVERFAKK